MAFVHTKTGTTDALDALNDRLARVVLQGDFQLGLAIIGLDGAGENQKPL